MGGFVFAGSFGLALADNVSIQNNVSVSAETGGNTGAVTNEGKASVDIRVESEVDGKKQAPVIVHEETVGGKIEKEIEVESEDGVVKTKIKTSAEAESNSDTSGVSANGEDGEDGDDGVETVSSKVTVSSKSTFLASVGEFFANVGNSIWTSIKSIF
ncbi:MAG: hypothetical protein AAB787_01015 [Patescibacteria group bacterium]